MINEEILGGLKSALERGESLRRAMMTLYNAGYKKEEIEECAKRLVLPEEVSNPPIQPIQETKSRFEQSASLKKPAPQIPKITSQIQQIQRVAPQIQPTKPQIQTAKARPVYIPLQRISDYGGEITPREKAIIFILVLLLIFLFVSLGLIFLFKQEIINFFGNFFG
jgi:hypothetical protein